MTTNLESILNYFTQIRRYHANELNKRLKDINLSPNEISILILLSNNHFITTSSQLVVLLGVSKGLISRSIDALVKKELIECKRDNGDKRVVHLYLTDKADALSKVLQLEIKKINKEILSDIPEERIKIMEETIIDIANAFKSKNDESDFK